MVIFPVNSLDTRKTNKSKIYNSSINTSHNPSFCGSFGFGNSFIENDIVQFTKETFSGVTERLTNISVWQQLQKYFSSSNQDEVKR